MLLGRIARTTCAVVALVALPLAAQTPSADAPSFRVGAMLFSDYTYQRSPSVIDEDGNRVHPSAFNVSRAYINVMGDLNRRLHFRVTSDILRETGSESSLSGSYAFRLKFAYAQFDLDQWTTKGSFIRAGLTPTPYLEFIENVYRYRFQGPMFADREGYIISSDFGISGRYLFPGDYGDVLVGIYNGEGFQRVELNDQKSIQGRVAIRPLPRSAAWKGLTLGVFYNTDHYVANGERQRFAPFALMETRWGKAGLEGIDARDQTSATGRTVHAEGYSLWATPKLTKTIEVLVRHDSIEPDKSTGGQKTRDILGVAYWIPNLQRVTSAVMVDGERVEYDDIPRADETRYAVRLLINF